LEWLERKPFDEFDFGYVLTVHKARLAVGRRGAIDESGAFQENAAGGSTRRDRAASA